jgi:mannose-6-phosphate isomerase-like protein (cupin superfamily)
MPKVIKSPSIIESAGNKPKRIEEFAGLVNSGHSQISIARMRSPSGWVEPGQCPDFTEYTFVLSGMLHVESKDGILKVGPNEMVITEPGEWIRYSTPGPEGATYLAICQPAFSPDAVHRDQN